MRFASLSAASITLITLAANAYASGGVPRVGDPAPQFTLTDQTGKAVQLGDYAGKIVVLEWFNDGCPYVKKHYKTGAMNALAAKYAKAGVVWLAVNSTKSADVTHNAGAAGEWKIDRPVLDDHAGTVGHLYGATNTPDMIVIGKDGKIAYRGAIDSVDSPDAEDIAGAKNYVSAALEELMSGKAVSNPETTPYGCTVKYAG